ncbi:MAG: cysteine desulfurase family protein [Bacteroidota bacterium]
MIRTDSHIYLDYAATTPLDPRVAESIAATMNGIYGNASSVHAFGRRAKVILEESRELIAKSIGAEPAEIFFTSGGTESDNHALTGSAFAQRRDKGKDHIIVSAIEHHAVLDCAEYLATLGFRVSFVPVDGKGRIIIDELQKLVTPKTAVISVMHANNEVGTLQPVKEISLLANARGIIFHTDAVQTFGKIPVNVNELGVNLLTLSAHKIYGPKGIGAIYIRKGTTIDALLHGGAQERKNRAGTENIPLIAGFAKAVELAEHDRQANFDHAERCASTLRAKLQKKLENCILNGDDRDSLPHILNVSIDTSQYDIEGDSLLMNMDLHGVAVSSGSACTSGSVQPSHVLLAMGRDEQLARTAIRFSFGKQTIVADVDRAGDIFCSIVHSLPRKK